VLIFQLFFCPYTRPVPGPLHPIRFLLLLLLPCPTTSHYPGFSVFSVLTIRIVL
jgi:hypothetical protein